MQRQPITVNPIPLLDPLVALLGRYLGRDAGLSWMGGGAAVFTDAWWDERGTLTVRLGRLEFTMDRVGSASARTA